MRQRIKDVISEGIKIKKSILSNEILIQKIEAASNLTINSLQAGNKILFCGNGGSAADAQHLATELSGRFYLDRAPLFAEALHSNISFLTAVANDYGYEHVFSRAVQAKGKPDDVLLGLSTSGNSQNVINALQTANELGLKTIGFTGEKGGKMEQFCDILISIPSKDTPRIQEGHIMIGHIICELVEAAIFGNK